MSFNDPWESLTSPDQGNLSLKTIDQENNYFWQWAKDSGNNYGIAIQLNSKNSEITDKFSSSKSLLIEINEYSNDIYLTVLCAKHDLKSIFELFCNNLIEDTKEITNEDQFINAVIYRINTWIKLFEKKYKSMSPKQILGLAAEIEFLKIWITKKNENISTWLGPENSPQDFISKNQNNAYEIKASSWDADLINISSINQLDFMGEIFLIVYPTKILDSTDSDAINLNTLIKSIKEITSPFDFSIFMGKLCKLGYHPKESNLIYFQLNKPICYEISRDFPRLTETSLPLGIVECKYKILLNLIEEYKISVDLI